MQAEQEQTSEVAKLVQELNQSMRVDHRQSKNASRVGAKPAKEQIQNQELNQSNNLSRVGAQAEQECKQSGQN